MGFVPTDFAIPAVPESPHFRLDRLGPEHNERDYVAWTSSMDHIASTPGFTGRDWPHQMPLDANRSDLVAHAADFENRVGFTYSVLKGDEVIGCLYIYPSRDEGSTYDADVRSWVVANRAELDVELWSLVSDWLAESWPFTHPEYAPRPAE